LKHKNFLDRLIIYVFGSKNNKKGIGTMVERPVGEYSFEQELARALIQLVRNLIVFCATDGPQSIKETWSLKKRFRE